MLDKIKGYVNKNFSKDLTVRFTGEGILINNAADYMASGQATSLGSSLLTIFAVMAILFMSFKAGIISMIPNIIPIILNFGIMGWFGVPLNTGTCMIAAIALGIAVDDTTHFMARYYKELKNTNDQQLEMALVGGGTRSANVIALEDTELLRIDDKSLDRVRRRFPRISAKLFLNISRVLSNRLKTQNYANF